MFMKVLHNQCWLYPITLVYAHLITALSALQRNIIFLVLMAVSSPHSVSQVPLRSICTIYSVENTEYSVHVHE